MSVIVLGGGLAGLSLASSLNDTSIILEKEEAIGGLCRSFVFNNIYYDIGPHILFSKNQQILDKIHTLVETNKIRRLNKILHKGKQVKYPFENDLAALPAGDREYCLKEFLSNPYENYDAKNMLQFFLKTFGEGITRLYLQPYNEKIWKFDPAYMDTQMVERIPKPPKEDVIKSAKGIETEGYTHQLYFHYPKKRGIQQLIQGYKNTLSGKSKIINPVSIQKIIKDKSQWVVETDKGRFTSSTLVNCMPLHELFRYIGAPDEIRQALNKLNYNSIYILIVQTIKDNLGDIFALNIADKNIIFHRLSKLNFLGQGYCLEKGSTIMVEITHRPDSYLSSLSPDQIKEMALSDLEKLNLVERQDIIDVELRDFKYAYVIYDLEHRKNTDRILAYLEKQGIYSNGRFARFEYLNMDQIIEASGRLAEELNRKSGPSEKKQTQEEGKYENQQQKSQQQK